ncbi:MAG: hypothetical protein Ct9H90mP3_5620 [Flammeovirgaceae bacterium]|nr:MAG: hypothetical protein Ct9H90mP3_5620 [Flammeovirgaceae bacterium]
MVVGSVLNVTDKIGGFYKIEYPDKRVGWVNQMDISPMFKNSEKTTSDIINNSKQFIGVPYLWGEHLQKVLIVRDLQKQFI